MTNQPYTVAMISIIVTIALVGLIVWLIANFIPMPPKFQQAIYVVAAVGLLLYLLSAFGLWNGFGHVRLR